MSQSHRQLLLTRKIEEEREFEQEYTTACEDGNDLVNFHKNCGRDAFESFHEIPSLMPLEDSEYTKNRIFLAKADGNYIEARFFLARGAERSARAVVVPIPSGANTDLKKENVKADQDTCELKLDRGKWLQVFLPSFMGPLHYYRDRLDQICQEIEESPEKWQEDEKQVQAAKACLKPYTQWLRDCLRRDPSRVGEVMLEARSLQKLCRAATQLKKEGNSTDYFDELAYFEYLTMPTLFKDPKKAQLATIAIGAILITASTIIGCVLVGAAGWATLFIAITTMVIWASNYFKRQAEKKDKADPVLQRLKLFGEGRGPVSSLEDDDVDADVVLIGKKPLSNITEEELRAIELKPLNIKLSS